jgi:hypothetical protein
MAATSFVAGLLQAANGFGFAVLAVPLFLLFAEPGPAVQLVVIVTLALSAVVLPGMGREVDGRLLVRLGLGGLAGLPLGLLAFRYADPIAVRAVIGVTILAHDYQRRLSRGSRHRHQHDDQRRHRNGRIWRDCDRHHDQQWPAVRIFRQHRQQHDDQWRRRVCLCRRHRNRRDLRWPRRHADTPTARIPDRHDLRLAARRHYRLLL